MTFFIKRFDRLPRNKKLAVEDFAQLAGLDRDTKYRSSMEQVAAIVATYCTYPKVEFVKLLKLTLFNFLVDYEDMHLKNFSLITKKDITTLSPCYDLINSTITINAPTEEIALSVNGKKKNITRKTLLEYYGKEKLGNIQIEIPIWHEIIKNSFLSEKMKEAYLSLLQEREKRLLSL